MSLRSLLTESRRASLIALIEAGPPGAPPPGLGAELPLIEWPELAKHCTKEDMWVCIDHIVYNMTNFIAIVAGEVDADTGMAIARHPGGMDLPMQFAGKDASLYWNDIHSHVKFDILEDVCMGEGWNTGLDVLPVIMGRTEGPTPPELEGGLPVQGKDTYDEVRKQGGPNPATVVKVECQHRQRTQRRMI